MSDIPPEHDAGTGPAVWGAVNYVIGKLEDDGYDTDRAFLVVMAVMPTGRVEDSSIAAHLGTGPVDARKLLDHVLQQMGPVARECGVQIVVQSVSN